MNTWTHRTRRSASPPTGPVCQLMATFGEEWDFEAQAQNAGIGVGEYALTMNPLLQMSMEQAIVQWMRDWSLE